VVNIEKPHDQTTKVDQIGKKDTVEKAVRLPKSIEEVGEDAPSFEKKGQTLRPLLTGKGHHPPIRERTGEERRCHVSTG
jgi:hypothetical protein